MRAPNTDTRHASAHQVMRATLDNATLGWRFACRPEGLLSAVVAGLATAALLAVAPGADGERTTRFILFAFFAMWVVLPWYLVACAWLRPRRWHDGLRIAVALALLFGWSLVVGALAHRWLHPAGLIAMPLGEFLGDIGIIAGILTLSIGILILQARQVQQWRQRSARADVSAWAARMRPHFLFNALNGIAELIESDPRRAEQHIESLCELLRAAMASGQQHVPLAEELALARKYLALEQMRLGERLRVDWQLPEPLPRVRIPLLCIQTLLENAVRHGIARLAEGGEIRVCGEVSGDQFALTITNPMLDAPPGELLDATPGIGLAASRARLHDTFGSRADLSGKAADGHFVCRLQLPLASSDA